MPGRMHDDGARFGPAGTATDRCPARDHGRSEPAPEVSEATLVQAQRIAGATVLPEFVYPELTSSCFPAAATEIRGFERLPALRSDCEQGGDDQIVYEVLGIVVHRIQLMRAP